MHDAIKNMTTTPIKEIVFSVSFEEILKLSHIEKFRESELVNDRFSEVIPGFDTKITNRDPDTLPNSDVTKSGYIFKCGPPCDKILQAKLGSISFHKIRQYQPYDTLIQEFSDYWRLLQENSHMLSVSSIALRYINFVEIDDGESIKDLVSINITHPFQGVLNEFYQLRIMLDEQSQTAGNVVVTNVTQNGKPGVVIDVSINRKISSQQFDDIQEAFSGMRDYKNEIFIKSVTEKTLSKYYG